MFTKSIRWQLQLWLAFLLVCILGGFGATAYQLHRTNQFHQIDQELQRRVSALSSALRGPPPYDTRFGRLSFGEHRERSFSDDGMKRQPPRRGSPESPGRHDPPDLPFSPREVKFSPQILSLFEEAETNGFYFLIWSREISPLKHSTNAPPEVPVPNRLEAGIELDTRMRENYREAFRFTSLGYCILVGRCITPDLEAMRRFAGWLVVAGGGVLALGLGGGWRLAGHTIRPIEEISTTARRISAGNLSERISVAGKNNEVGRLAEILNCAFARLEAAFAQQKQFTADASHELRTPIAVLIAETQTTLSRQRTAAEYRETVEVCLDTAQQMRRLTESLLELARLDAGQEAIQHRPVDLAEITRACVERLLPLARERGIQVQTHLAPAEVVGDPDRLGQVITNLLSNAVHYNRDQGEIRVGTAAKNGVATLEVADTGQGIAPEDLPHVFERFYRGDKSRARANGRWGLGLAISKAIVDAHGGRIEATSTPGRGTQVRVQLGV